MQSLDIEELKKIVDRARAAGLAEDDCDKLKLTMESLRWLQEEIARRSVTIARLRSLFGIHKSEKTEDVLKDKESDDPPQECDGESKGGPAKKRKAKGHGRNGARKYEGADRIDVPHESLESGGCCPSCSTPKPGKVYDLKTPSTLIRVCGQAPLHAKAYDLQRLRCNLCGDVFKAKPPEGVGSKKYDATAASMIGLLKYGTGLPFYRLANLQRGFNIPLPPSTQWDIVNGAAKELNPVFEQLIKQAAQGHLLHNDDTTMRVLELKKELLRIKAAGESDRTGIFTTGIVSELSSKHRITLYLTGNQHAGENIADVLAHRAADLGHPIQMCDALDQNLPKAFKTVLSNCLAHARRKFVDVASSFPRECRRVLEALREIYKNDATARKQEMSDAERLSYHQEYSSALMNDLLTWMNEQIDGKRVEPNSSLGQAITYMTSRWDLFTLFLRQPGAPLDNNIVERALKKAILHRKNALFYKTQAGARVGDLFMSLIYTAESAGKNPFEYLTALLSHPAEIAKNPQDWLPWNYAAALAELRSPDHAVPA